LYQANEELEKQVASYRQRVEGGEFRWFHKYRKPYLPQEVDAIMKEHENDDDMLLWKIHYRYELIVSRAKKITDAADCVPKDGKILMSETDLTFLNSWVND
jgi:hypothetical protein